MSTKRTQISINLYTVRASGLPYGEQLKKLREIGYQSIQGGLTRDMTKEQQKSIHDDLGMELSAFGGELRDIDRNTGRYLEGCHYFDCDEIMIGTMPAEFREDADGYRKAIDLINAVGRKLAKEDVYLAYHNHAQEFRRFPGTGKTGIGLLYENLDPAAVHFMLDTHWVQAGGGDVIEWMQKCKGRMQYMHVKDYRIAPANYLTSFASADKQFAEIGEGNLPWPLIIETGLAQGIRSFIVEQDFSYGVDPFACAATSYRNLRSYGLK